MYALFYSESSEVRPCLLEQYQYLVNVIAKKPCSQSLCVVEILGMKCERNADSYYYIESIESKLPNSNWQFLVI